MLGALRTTAEQRMIHTATAIRRQRPCPLRPAWPSVGAQDHTTTELNTSRRPLGFSGSLRSAKDVQPPVTAIPRGPDRRAQIFDSPDQVDSEPKHSPKTHLASSTTLARQT